MTGKISPDIHQPFCSSHRVLRVSNVSRLLLDSSHSTTRNDSSSRISRLLLLLLFLSLRIYSFVCELFINVGESMPSNVGPPRPFNSSRKLTGLRVERRKKKGVVFQSILMLFHFFLSCWLLCRFFQCQYFSSLTLFLHCSQFFFFSLFLYVFCPPLFIVWIHYPHRFFFITANPSSVTSRWFLFLETASFFASFVAVFVFFVLSNILFFFYDVPIDNICVLCISLFLFVVIYCSIFIVKIHYSQRFFSVATNLFFHRPCVDFYF